MHPVLIEIGPFEIRYYSLMYLLAITIGIFLLRQEVARKGIALSKDDVINLVLFSVFGGIICARLYYVAFNWDYYSAHIKDIPAIWKGGLASHGGFIGGFIVAYLYLRHYKVPIWKIGDSILPIVVLGEAFVRFGNFMNGEAHGMPTTMPWGIVFPQGSTAGAEFPNTPVHPTMLYQLFYNLMAFFVVWFGLRKKEYKDGFVAAVIVIVYSIGRFFIEGMRADSLYLGPFRVAQIMSVALISAMTYIILSKRLWLRTHKS
jgi:phosphatidylglycerol:prolipoprotein diacylglycerol transferase